MLIRKEVAGWKMYEDWSVDDHLANISVVLHGVLGGKLAPIDIADALAQIDIIRVKLGLPIKLDKDS